ncbi:MAG: hypothetical protein ACKOWO_06535 [Sediminibacterium sp.]
MYLITSGEFVTNGLENEFGHIPPAFLPFQNKRLVNHLIGQLPSIETIYLSIPEAYEVNKKDYLDFQLNNIKLLRIPKGLTLGQSIIHSLNAIGKYNEVINIMHGDTLFHETSFPVDTFLISETKVDYNWAYLENDIKENIVYAGYFSFSKQSILIKSIIENGYDFIKGINNYKKEVKVEEIFVEKWYDFGNVNTFFRSKSILTSQRVFNDMSIENQVVHKSSSNSKKIVAEANWFNYIPNVLKIYTPQIYNVGIKNGKKFYELEYLPLSSLSEFFVFGNSQGFVWLNILESCQIFLNTCYSLKPNESIATSCFESLYGPKTIRRLEEFMKESKFEIDKPIILNGENYPPLIDIAKNTSMLIKPVEPRNICVNHGDFCFSNILYDYRLQNIKVIDPRGLDGNNNETIYGDFRYDVAKLAHSIIGLYDFIIAGYYIFEEKDAYDFNFEIYSNPNIKVIQDNFLKMKFAGKTLKDMDTFPILVHLFLSMLPLHSDDIIRQKALISNALLIYKQIYDDNNYSNGR